MAIQISEAPEKPGGSMGVLLIKLAIAGIVIWIAYRWLIGRSSTVEASSTKTVSPTVPTDNASYNAPWVEDNSGLTNGGTIGQDGVIADSKGKVDSIYNRYESTVGAAAYVYQQTVGTPPKFASTSIGGHKGNPAYYRMLMEDGQASALSLPSGVKADAGGLNVGATVPQPVSTSQPLPEGSYIAPAGSRMTRRVI